MGDPLQSVRGASRKDKRNEFATFHLCERVCVLEPRAPTASPSLLFFPHFIPTCLSEMMFLGGGPVWPYLFIVIAGTLFYTTRLASRFGRPDNVQCSLKDAICVHARVCVRACVNVCGYKTCGRKIDLCVFLCGKDEHPRKVTGIPKG